MARRPRRTFGIRTGRGSSFPEGHTGTDLRAGGYLDVHGAGFQPAASGCFLKFTAVSYLVVR